MMEFAKSRAHRALRAPVPSVPFTFRAPVPSVPFTSRAPVPSVPFTSRAPVPSVPFKSRAPVPSVPFTSRAPVPSVPFKSRALRAFYIRKVEKKILVITLTVLMLYNRLLFHRLLQIALGNEVEIQQKEWRK